MVYIRRRLTVFLGLTNAEWLDLGITFAAVFLAFILIRLLSNVILKRLMGSIVGRTKTDLDDVLLDITRLPLQLALMTIVLDLAINRLFFLPDPWAEPIDDGFFVAYVVIVFLFLWRLTSSLAQWYGREAAELTDTELDEQLLPFFRRVALLGLLAIMLIILLGHFGVEVSGLVATLGVGSLVIGLAGQAALADTISGFLIMIDRPFRIGDRIEILELDTWGDVVDVGLRSARIRTRDNRLVVVPNSILGESLIVNHSYPDSHYRIEVHVGVGYESDVELARQTMIEAASEVEGVWEGRPVEALFLEMGDSALIFRIRVWIESYEDTRRIVDRVNTAVFQALKEVDIDIPFPHRVVHHQLGQSDFDELSKRLR
jgi:small-conductance mechanosensitive channel